MAKPFSLAETEVFERNRKRFIKLFFETPYGDRDSVLRGLFDDFDGAYSEVGAYRLPDLGWSTEWSDGIKDPNQIGPEELGELETWLGVMATVSKSSDWADILG